MHKRYIYAVVSKKERRGKGKIPYYFWVFPLYYITTPILLVIDAVLLALSLPALFVILGLLVWLEQRSPKIFYLKSHNNKFMFLFSIILFTLLSLSFFLLLRTESITIIYLFVFVLIIGGAHFSGLFSFLTSNWLIAKQYDGYVSKKPLIIDGYGITVGSSKDIKWYEVRKIYRLGQLFILRMYGKQTFYCFLETTLIWEMLEHVIRNNLKIFHLKKQNNKLFYYSQLSLIIIIFLLAPFIIWSLFVMSDLILFLLARSQETSATALLTDLYTFFNIHYLAMSVFFATIALLWVLFAPLGTFKTYDIYNGYIVVKLFSRVLNVVELMPRKSLDSYKKRLERYCATLYWLHTLDENYRVELYKTTPFVSILLGLQLWGLYFLSLMGKNKAEDKLRYLKAEGNLE